MAYTLHIERQRPITPQDVNEAVGLIANLRMNTGDSVLKNPDTDEEILIPVGEGGISVLFKSGGFLGFGVKETWHHVFYLSQGSIKFIAFQGLEDPNNPVRIAASELATALEARIRGDQGEPYNWS